VVVASTASFNIIKRFTLLPEWVYMFFDIAATKDNDPFPGQHLPAGLYNADGLCPPLGSSEFLYTVYI